MMAQVAQKQKNVVEESSLNQVESKNFIKKMLAIGISNIVYLRNLFPESAFSDRRIEDLPLKILKENSHEGAGRIVHWMKGVYDAIEREYLRALIFAIVTDPEKTDSVIESYVFGFSYDQGCVQASVTIGEDSKTKTNIPTKQQTKESAKKFLRNLLLLTSTMDSLPTNVFMTVRLLYYDKATPGDYQPPGFVEAIEKDTLGFVFDNIRIKLGHIVTPHTSMKVRVRAGRDQFERRENENGKQNYYMSDSEMTDVSKADPRTLPTEEEMKRNSQKDNESDNDLGVRCPCLDPHDDGIMIECSKCQFWQHAICFCICDENDIPDVHICHLCCDNVNTMCTDPQLSALKKEQRQEMCAWRRTLQRCGETDAVSITEISGWLSCTRIVAQKIVGKLTREKIAKMTKGQQRQTKVIDQEALKAVFNRDVVHVAENLCLQRKDEQMRTSFEEKADEAENCQKENYIRKGKRAAADSDIHAQQSCVEDNKTAKRFGRGLKLSSPPLNSQSSIDAFRQDMNRVGPSPRKRRKASRTSSSLSSKR